MLLSSDNRSAVGVDRMTNFYRSPPTDAKQNGVMAPNAGAAAISQTKFDFVNLSSHPIILR